MGKYNLNNPTDFARAVSTGPADVLNLFNGGGKSAWDIQEASYYIEDNANVRQEVIFHIFKTASDYQAAVNQVSDKGGRRKAKFLFPYIDGQLTEDLGRTPGSFSFDILIFGNNYKRAFVDLMKLLNNPRPGTLVHPVLGNITCVMESFDITHKSDSRKAVAINLTMIEHSFTGLQVTLKEDPSAPSKIQGLLDSFKKISNAIDKVEAFTFAARTLKNTIKGVLADYKDAYAKVASGLNVTFNASQDIPGLLPVNEGGLLNPDGTFAAEGVSSVSSPSDPFQQIPAELTNSTLSQALAIEQLQKDIQSTRDTVSNAISLMESAGNGQGAFESYDEIQGLKQTVIDLQLAFEAGQKSSIVRVIQYKVPNLMTIREAAFANKISIDDIEQIYLLNPELPSVNYIEAGTLLKVAVS